MSRFSDQFGVPVTPSLILRNNSVPDSARTVEATIGFRDLLAAAIVPLGRSRALSRGRAYPFDMMFSDYFSLYPWMTDPSDEHFTMQTSALLAEHDVSEFQGQTHPSLSVHNIEERDVDEVILEALVESWNRRFCLTEPSTRDVILFRSLTLAYSAMRQPTDTTAPTLYDVGRTIVDWVSAFEILAHQGNRQRGLPLVYTMLQAISWRPERIRHRRYRARRTNAQDRVHRNLACKLYGELYGLRNNFAHGNPVQVSHLLYGRTTQRIDFLATPIYREAIANHIGMTLQRRRALLENTRRYGNDRIFDHAILSAVPPRSRFTPGRRR